MDNFHGMQSSGQMVGRKTMSGGAGHGSQKTYKRGGNSLGPNQGTGSQSGLRPGTAQKRPASPNTQGLAAKNGIHHNGPSPYSFGLVQQHNNLIGGGVSTGQGHGITSKNRANSQKPSSAPSKNRIRSQSPINVEQNQNQGGNSGAQYSQSNGNAKQKNLIGGNFGGGGGGLGNSNKMLSNTGGFGGMMTQGQGVHNNLMGGSSGQGGSSGSQQQ